MVILVIKSTKPIKRPFSIKACKFLGDISYPVYITHYPLIYTYVAWVTNNKVPIEKGLFMGLVLFVTSITIAYTCLKIYDEPVRNLLQKRFLVKRA